MSNQDKSTDVFKAWFAQTWLNDSLATDFYYIFFHYFITIYFIARKAESEIMWEINSATFNYRSYQFFSLPIAFLRRKKELLQTDLFSSSPCSWPSSALFAPEDREHISLTFIDISILPVSQCLRFLSESLLSGLVLLVWLLLGSSADSNKKVIKQIVYVH